MDVGVDKLELEGIGERFDEIAKEGRGALGGSEGFGDDLIDEAGGFGLPSDEDTGQTASGSICQR